MKRCPFCGEKIQNAAIKCRFCHERLQDNNKTEKRITSKKDYRRVGIISLVLYLVAFSNLPISHIGDKLREGEILWIITSENMFLVGLLFLIIGFIISNNKIVRLILGITFGLSLLVSIGVSLNNEQKEIDRNMAIIFSTNECQKSLGENSHGDGTTNSEGGYNCDCNDGYTKNTDNTKCITASESCNELYPGSISDGTKNGSGGYNCKCPQNLAWNGKSTKCITLTQSCKEKYGKNAYSNGHQRIGSDGKDYFTCYY